ncbi:AAA family ATPase [Mucilaginibacter roseus]|uniref:AAA family ATPase n=1 Tax=Mucilaginibacter roseus TaxID=1528868 RepID=A0ABS8TZH1_9SPHI|nr:AAA family ATPase [Mucilaginibacter roseus]MCD8740269.1 AAA family ATPase [Mucilaginibacter roseus]
MIKLQFCIGKHKSNMRINIMGASGAGVTTLGRALANATGYAYIDSDDYYWDNAGHASPFTIRRQAANRNQMLLHDLRSHGNWILGGPVMNWGVLEHVNFDMVVFLQLPPQLRMARLKKREHERYGDIIFSDATRNRQFVDFMNWAAGYDDNTAPSSRTLQNQLSWLQSLNCPVLRITGDTTVDDRLNRVLKAIQQADI